MFYTISELIIMRVLAVIWLCHLVLGRPRMGVHNLRDRFPPTLPIVRRELEIIHWRPDVKSFPCPTKRENSHIRISNRDITVAGLACDWDKMDTMDRVKVELCQQAVVKIGTQTVKVACLPHLRSYRQPEGFDFNGRRVS